MTLLVVFFVSSLMFPIFSLDYISFFEKFVKYMNHQGHSLKLGPETRDLRSETQNPDIRDPETRDPGTLRPRTRDPETPDSGTLGHRTLELGP